MPVEAAQYVNQLSQSNPAGSDPTGQGDDHLRLIKLTLKNTFPNAGRAIFFDVPAPIGTVGPAPTNADGGTIYSLDASGGAITVELPASPDDGVTFTVRKTDYSLQLVTVDGNGKTINGESTQVLTKAYQKIVLYYSTELGEWIAAIDTVIPTGSFLDSGAASINGYLICDGTTTIGSATSGANLIGLKYRALFEHLWNTYSDTACPVTGGRGASASADWNANKRIRMADLRGYFRAARDNMGGVAASRLTAASIAMGANTVGNTGGAETTTLSRANLPNFTMSATGTAAADGNHTHQIVTGISSANSISVFALKLGDDNIQTNNGTLGTPSSTSRNTLIGPSGTHTHSVSATTESVNGNTTQTAFSRLPPVFITNTFMAL